MNRGLVEWICHVRCKLEGKNEKDGTGSESTVEVGKVKWGSRKRHGGGGAKML